MSQEYVFDKITQYAVDELDKTIMVVNREYSNIQYTIKKSREKLSRLKAGLYELQQSEPNEKEDIERLKPRLIADVLLRTVPGVQISSDGVTTFITLPHALSLPFVFIDGNEFTWKDSFSPLDMINVNEVESIDVIPLEQSAIFGARGGGGAISITTKKGGIENINQGYNYTVYTPLSYQKPVEFYAPKYETLEEKQLSIPDYRTTIYWKPDVVISEDTGKAIVEFYTSDYPATYSVVIEGLTTDGKIIRQVGRIIVQ